MDFDKLKQDGIKPEGPTRITLKQAFESMSSWDHREETLLAYAYQFEDGTPLTHRKGRYVNDMICQQIFDEEEFFIHVEEVHGIKVEAVRVIAGRLIDYS